MPTIDYSNLDIDTSKEEEESPNEADFKGDISSFSESLAKILKESKPELHVDQPTQVDYSPDTKIGFFETFEGSSGYPPPKLFGYPTKYVYTTNTNTHIIKDPHISDSIAASPASSQSVLAANLCILEENLNKGDELFQWEVMQGTGAELIQIRLKVHINGKTLVSCAAYTLEFINQAFYTIADIKTQLLQQIFEKIVEESIQNDL